MCKPVRLSRNIRTEDHLDNTASVAQINEDQAAMVPPSKNPSGEIDGGANR
jgi:hypothetical protein